MKSKNCSISKFQANRHGAGSQQAGPAAAGGGRGASQGGRPAKATAVPQPFASGSRRPAELANGVAGTGEGSPEDRRVERGRDGQRAGLGGRNGLAFSGGDRRNLRRFTDATVHKKCEKYGRLPTVKKRTITYRRKLKTAVTP